jgi:hypothetical protein
LSPTTAAAPRSRTVKAGFNFASQAQSAGFNISDGTCIQTPATGDQQGVDPRLSPLANNGGPTQTVALLTGSPAVDTGNPGPTGTLCAGSDQRGIGRPIDGNVDGQARCDKGAYEAPACTNDRRNVALTVGGAGSNIIHVTITAGVGTITRVRGIPTRSSNIVVEINGPPSQRSNLVFVPVSPSTVVQMALHRASGTGSGTLAFFVTDGCADWETLAGGGPNAWPEGASAPASIDGPMATAAPVPTPATALTPGAACASFATHAEAQAYLRTDPTDPRLIDKNRNGIAYEGSDRAGFVNPPLDYMPVPRP